MQGLNDDEVRNCTFNLLCTKTWPELARIDGERNVRFCHECSEVVHLCTTPAQVAAHAAERHCVAIRRRDGLMMLGDITPESD